MPTGKYTQPPDFIGLSSAQESGGSHAPMGETGRVVLPKTQRDFLTGESLDATPMLQTGIDPFLLAELHSRMANIERFLAQIHPSVLLRVEVDGAWTGSQFTIKDANSHKVTFLSGREKFAAYKLLLFSNYGNNSPMWDFSPMAATNLKDGIPFPSSPLILDNITVEEMYIMVPTLVGGTCNVNGPADGTNGGLTIFAWGIPEYSYHAQSFAR